MIKSNPSTTRTELQGLQKKIPLTADFVVSKVWRLAAMDPRQTGGSTWGQRRAFRLLLELRGGVGFIASRPKAELAALGRRGICARNLHMILRQMAGLEVQRHRGLINASGFEAEIRRLLRDAVRPGRLS